MIKQLDRKLIFIFAALFLAAAYLPAHATVIYVDSLATGANNGSSWTSAYTDLQDGLTATGSGDTIWVAKGTYFPTSTADRYGTFQLLNAVAIYGGFAGNETDISERDWVANVTILSGDIGILDDDTDNSIHVVTGSGTNATAVLDGFTITAGNANANTSNLGLGGGMYNYTGSPTVTNVVFFRNAANTNGGGGMFNGWGSNPTLTNVEFLENSALGGGSESGGGGMYNYSDSNPTLTNVTFMNNEAWNRGGGMNNNNSNPTLINVIFWNNLAGHGGGLFSDGSTTLSLTNVTFANNTANVNGGGMYNYYSSSSAITNTIAWGNSAVSLGDQLFQLGSGSTPVSYSLIEGPLPSGYTDEGHNIYENPKFVDESSGNLRLNPTSPAANSGNNAAVPGGVTTDLDGNPRIAGIAIDMGAYEYPCPPGSVVYVDKYATTGENTGEDWDNAFLKLSEALEWAACEGVTELWVAEGTYYPTSGSDRGATFQLVDSVAVYGGFVGGESSVSERDWVTNETILSGDIGTEGTIVDNSVHVVTGSGTDATAVLNGFTITQGNADGAGDDNGGGGMITVSGSPTIVNVIFTENVAWDNGGGGMFNGSGSDPSLFNVTFAGNWTTYRGGGMFNWNNSNPTLEGVTFSGNSGQSGGGMHNDNSSPTLANVVFVDNMAQSGNGGGMFNCVGSSPTLVNVTFSLNSAIDGGGIYNWDESNPTLVNTILWGNTAWTGVQEISNNVSCIPTISHSLIEGSGGSGSWDTNLGTDLGNNIDADPLFVDAPVGDLRLIPISPAVDAGDNAAIPGGVTTDLDGNPRIANEIVDMGAYESQASCPPGIALYVDAKATGASDGTSWLNAFPELRYALDWVIFCPSVTEIWVAAGMYKPTAGTVRTATFQLLSGITIYGGFAGNESDRSQRDPVTNVTVLSGDIGVETDGSDNSYHVVTAGGTDATAVLDGFTITGGNADAPVTLAPPARSEAYDPADVKPAIAGETVTGSRSSAAWVDTHGGGIYNDGGSPTLANLVLSDNYAVDGGGMYNDGGSPALVNVQFRDNSGLWGGGMHNYDGGSPTLVNVIFWNGSADFGGAVYNNWCEPRLVNVTASGNSAYRGGAMYNTFSDPALVNTIMWGNSAQDAGHEIYNTSSAPGISHSLVAGSGGSGGGWDTSLGGDGGGNIDADPLFFNPSTGDVRLFPGSPVIDAGDNTAPDLPSTDIEGNPRIVNGTVDMGAYEVKRLCVPGVVLYVDAGATSGNNDGTSWQDAITDLWDALDWLMFCPGMSEIWVADGTYKPTSGADRDATFQMVNGLAIYGGFAGGETSISQRDWVTNVAVLSGDIGVEADSTDNSYNVVTASGTDVTAALDGFTVTGGYADSVDAYINRGNGGGMYNYLGYPKIRNVTFLGNAAIENGGGMYNHFCNQSLDNVTFTGNSAGGNGGGMYTDVGGAGPALLTDVTFSGNSALGNGGGMYNDDSGPPMFLETLLTDVTFSENSAGGNGGGMYNNQQSLSLTTAIFSGNSANAHGGGIYNSSGNTMSITNATFSGNSAISDGGGLLEDTNNFTSLINVVFTGNSALSGGAYNNRMSNSTFTNATFSGNTAGGDGGGMFFMFGTADLHNTILWNNSAVAGYNEISSIMIPGSVTISYSLIEGGVPPECVDHGLNVYSDPLFVDGPGGNVRLQTGSPAIDVGDNFTPYIATTDRDGNPRIVNGIVDMGAYEYSDATIASAYPSPLVFDQAPVNQTTCDTIYVVNEGGTTCTIEGIYGCTASPFSMDTTLTVHSLSAGDTTKIVVCVHPAVAGADSANVTIVSDADNSPTTVKVRIDIVTAVGPDRTPKPFRIVSVSPNPFNPTTAVHFTLPSAMPVTATIWSVTGARVRVLADNERFEPGDNRIVWDGRTDQGTPAASGVYFIRVETRLGAKVARAVLLK